MRATSRTRSRALAVDWDIEEILDSLNLPFESSDKARRKIQSASAIDAAKQSDLAFCSAEGERAAELVGNSRAGAILCARELKGRVAPRDSSQTLYFVSNPRLAFVKILNYIRDSKAPQGISPLAVIHDSATVGRNCYVGEYVVIGSGCSLGDNTVVWDRVSLVQNTHLGSGCTVQSGSTIGADGFAFEREESGSLVRFPHSGRVLLGELVEVSANCSIARGSLSDTVIGRGTKLDALVHVAHNVTIGRDCELTAGTVIGGSTRIGDSCWTGLNCTIKNKLSLGNNVIVASGASVIRDVPDGDIVAGVPAKSIKHKVTTKELYLMAGQKKNLSAGSSVA